MRIKLSRQALVAGLVMVNLVLLSGIAVLWQMRSERARSEELRALGATEFPAAQPLANFSLQNHSGQVFTNTDLMGKWSLVYFGFTSCNDICPITTAELTRLLHELDTHTRQIPLQVLFASVDPATDTPPILAEYLQSFHGQIIGLTGDIGNTVALARQLYVVFEENTGSGEIQQHGVGHESPAAASHQIDHSDHLSLIDPAGRLRAVIRPPHRSRDIAAVLNFFL